MLVLAHDFLRDYAKQYPRFKKKRLGADAARALVAYPWPGNVRELKSVVERAMMISDADELLPADLLLDGPHAIAPWAERVKDSGARNPQASGDGAALPEPAVLPDPAALQSLVTGPPEASLVAVPSPADLGLPMPASAATAAAEAPEANAPIVPLEDLKRKAVEHAYAVCDQSAERAAQELGIGRATMYRLLKKYEIEG